MQLQKGFGPIVLEISHETFLRYTPCSQVVQCRFMTWLTSLLYEFQFSFVGNYHFAIVMTSVQNKIYLLRVFMTLFIFFAVLWLFCELYFIGTYFIWLTYGPQYKKMLIVFGILAVPLFLYFFLWLPHFIKRTKNKKNLTSCRLEIQD